MTYKIQAGDEFQKRLEAVFNYLDESFTFGSENEGTADIIEEKFVRFWDFHLKYSDLPNDEEIKEFAMNLENELYEMEAMEELRIDD